MKFLEIAELDVLSRALNMSTPTLRVSTRIEAYSCKAVGREKKLFKALESDIIQDISHSTSISPPEHHPGLLDSAFGPLDKRASRKTLWLLIGLLNVAFPDHDFSKVRPEEFRKEDGPRVVLSSLSAAMDHLRSPESQRSFSSYPPSSSLAFPSSPSSDPLSLSGTTPTLDDPSGTAGVAASSTSTSAPAPGTSANANSSTTFPTNPLLRRVLDPVIDLNDCECFVYTPDMDSDPHAGAESDDESDAESDSGSYYYEGDDGDAGMAWEMDGLDSSSPAGGYSLGGGGSGGYGGYGGAGTGSAMGYGSFASRNNTVGPTWSGGYGTPVKSFSAFLPPGTPTGSEQGQEDWSAAFEGSGKGSLLWSSHYFLFNRKMKRILFISIWGSSRNQTTRRRPRYAGAHPSVARFKRRASTASLASLTLDHDTKKTRA
ncbi:Maf1 regulator [Meredithblackwellia eburnea MCA 4105]